MSGVSGPCSRHIGAAATKTLVKRLASGGVTTYVEVGPGTVLSGLVRKIHREAAVHRFSSPDGLAAVEAILHA